MKVSKIKEEAPAMSAGTGGFSSSSPAAGPTAGLDPVMKTNLKNKIKDKMIRRAKPPTQPGVMVSDNN